MMHKSSNNYRATDWRNLQSDVNLDYIRGVLKTSEYKLINVLSGPFDYKVIWIEKREGEKSLMMSRKNKHERFFSGSIDLHE